MIITTIASTAMVIDYEIQFWFPNIFSNIIQFPFSFIQFNTKYFLETLFYQVISTLSMCFQKYVFLLLYFISLHYIQST